MKLSAETGADRDNVTAAQLDAAVARLGQPGHGFIVLARDDQTYLQAATTDRGFLLEYREGTGDSHHSSVRDDLSRSELSAVFRSYLAEAPDWHRAIRWRPGEGHAPPPPTGARSGGAELPTNRARGVSVPLAIGAALALAAAGWQAGNTLEYLEHAVTVPGKVVELTPARRRMHTADVEFTDREGQVHRFRSNESRGGLAAWRVGDPVEVIYDPRPGRGPRDARIRSVLALWGDTLAPLLVAVVAAVFLVVFWRVGGPRSPGRRGT